MSDDFGAKKNSLKSEKKMYGMSKMIQSRNEKKIQSQSINNKIMPGQKKIMHQLSFMS